MKARLRLGLLIIVMVLCYPSLGLTKGKVIRWKVQGFVPAGMLYHDVLLHTADEVKRATDGRLVWQVFPSGALVPPFEGVKAVSDGVYEVNYGYSAQWVGKIPGSVAPLFCSVPGGFGWVDMQMWLEQGGGKELEQEMYDKNGFNVKLFHGPPVSMESFMWAKKPLRKLEDFKGLKMRMMPLMGDVLSKHGMSVVFMPAGEIMPNLQRGVIDAAEYSIPAFDKTLGIWEVCKYVTLPGIHQPAGQTEFLINKKAYEALPDDLKAKLEMAIYKARFKEFFWTEFKNLEAVDFFNQKGIKTVVMEPETIMTITKWANDYLDELAAKDEFFAKVWGSQKEFGEKWYPYATTHNLPH